MVAGCISHLAGGVWAAVGGKQFRDSHCQLGVQGSHHLHASVRIAPSPRAAHVLRKCKKKVAKDTRRFLPPRGGRKDPPSPPPSFRTKKKHRHYGGSLMSPPPPGDFLKKLLEITSFLPARFFPPHRLSPTKNLLLCQRCFYAGLMQWLMGQDKKYVVFERTQWSPSIS